MINISLFNLFKKNGSEINTTKHCIGMIQDCNHILLIIIINNLSPFHNEPKYKKYNYDPYSQTEQFLIHYQNHQQDCDDNHNQHKQQHNREQKMQGQMI